MRNKFIQVLVSIHLLVEIEIVHYPTVVVVVVVE